MTTKVNPAATTNDVEHFGRDTQFFIVDYVVANASTGPLGAQNAVRNTIMETATIVAIGPMLDTNSQQTFAVEGADSVVVGTLQTVDGVDLSGATVTATKLGILKAAAVS